MALYKRVREICEEYTEKYPYRITLFYEPTWWGRFWRKKSYAAMYIGGPGGWYDLPQMHNLTPYNIGSLLGRLLRYCEYHNTIKKKKEESTGDEESTGGEVTTFHPPPTRLKITGTLNKEERAITRRNLIALKTSIQTEINKLEEQDAKEKGLL